MGALIRFIKFLSPEVALYLYYKSTIRMHDGILLLSCLGWCSSSCYLELLDKLQK